MSNAQRRPAFLASARFALAAALFAGASVAHATFTDNRFETYDQNVWGANPLAGPPASIVQAHFFDLFTAGAVFGNPVAGGFYMDFSGPDAILTYLPSSGIAAALDHTITDPGSTSSGRFGGNVVALAFNIGFSDLGYIEHSSGIAFGDLLLTGYGGSLSGLNGLTVRDLDHIANVLLGGGSESFDLQEISATLESINAAFEGGQGYISDYGEEHFALPTVTTSIPEPSSWVLLLLGLLVVNWRKIAAQSPSIRTIVASPARAPRCRTG